MISLHTSLFQFVAKQFAKPTHSFVYVAMGDSAAEGIGATKKERTYPAIIHSYLTKHYKNVSYHNIAKRRSPVSWVLNDQLEKTITLNPDLITLSVGANDIRVKNMPWKFEKELRHLIKTLKTETNAVIIINSMPDFTHTAWIPFLLKPVIGVSIKHFNTIIERVAREEKIEFVDLYPQGSIFSKYPESIGEDGFHPSDFGYALWANSILHVLKGLTFSK